MRALQQPKPWDWFMILLVVLFSACSQKCIVVSDSNIYHVKSGEVIEYNDAATFEILDEIALSSKDLKSLELAKADVIKDSTEKKGRQLLAKD